MNEASPIDEVLQTTAELLRRSDASSVSAGEVLGALGWPTERELEVLQLMARLVETGQLRGPVGGPLRGDNQIIAVDVLGVTEKGEERLAQLARSGDSLPSSDQQRFMTLVFDHFSRTGDWPVVAQLQRALARRGDRFDLSGVTIPSELGFRDTSIRTAGLTIRGAFAIAPGSQEVADFATAMRMCCELYLNEDKPKLTSTMLREKAGMDELRIKKVRTLLQSDPFLTGGGGYYPDGTWDLNVWDERCHYFLDAVTAADYVATADRLCRPGSPFGGRAAIILPAITRRLEDGVREADAVLATAVEAGPEGPAGTGTAAKQQRPAHSAGVDLARVVDGFHPRIRDACRQLVAHQHYPPAVLKATIALRDLLREKSGLVDLDGPDLAGQALSPRSPRIAVADLTTDTGRSIQRGTLLLAQGVFAAMRNVVAHNDVSIAPDEALEMLATISFVARRIDAAPPPTPVAAP